MNYVKSYQKIFLLILRYFRFLKIFEISKRHFKSKITNFQIFKKKLV